MDSRMRAYTTIDEYIEMYPQEIKVILEKFREVIKKAAPEAVEAISYGIPTFKLSDNLVHFGGFKNHLGFFPTGAGVEVFQKELADFDVSKGTFRFPYDKPIPYDLITKIVKYRVSENTKKKK